MNNDLSLSIYKQALQHSLQTNTHTLTHSVEHAGYGAILSRLMTGFNRSLDLNANYSFKIQSPYAVEALFDIAVKQPTEVARKNKLIEWNFFKDTWDQTSQVRANHQFPTPPAWLTPTISRHQWCAVLAYAICGNPKFELKIIIDATKAQLQWDQYDLIVGVHVRRGDKTIECPYIPNDVYISHFESIRQKNSGKRIALFLASDDPESYAQFKEKLLDIPILWDATEDRYNNGNANMVDANPALAKQESLAAAKNISLLGNCDYVIGMASAQFTWLGGLLSSFRQNLDASKHIMIDAQTLQKSHWSSTYGFTSEGEVPIKILHIVPDESGGGAAKAAYRIHQALKLVGISSKMLVLKKSTSDESVYSINGGIKGKIVRKFYKKLNQRRNQIDPNFNTENHTLHSLGYGGRGLVAHLNQSDADIIHLHWIIGMLSIEDIGKITKPIIWSCADMWPFCGAEHYVMDDSPTARFRIGYLENNRPSYESGPDINRTAWELKLKAWKGKNFTLVGISKWMTECLKSSPLFKGGKVESISLPLDVHSIWKPYPKDLSRALFKLPIDKKLIVAGAAGGVQQMYKGGDLLQKALQAIKESGEMNVELVLFGNALDEKLSDWSIPVHNIGKIQDETLLAKLYSCADVVVMPSRQEAFGQIASEAQACGIPVAAFNIGGPKDIIEHQVTGWLAKAYDAADLAKGIMWSIEQSTSNPSINKVCRKKAIKMFDPRSIATQYRDLYKITLEKCRD